jgi:hypothetical protein
MKIRSVGAEVLYVDRQTDGRTGGWTDRQIRQIDLSNLKVVFRYFANAPDHGALWTLTLRRLPVIKTVHKIPFGT